MENDDNISLLREKFYNSTVEKRIDINSGLMILRIRPDKPYPHFAAGQYTTLGLGEWEPRVDGVASSWNAADTSPHTPIVRRAYSISCPLLGEQNQLVGCNDLPFIEFYIALISRRSDHPPMLTPRLFALHEGSRLHLGPRPHGHYTTSMLRPTDDVAFFATGTGEAPHNAMLAELLTRGHAGRLLSVVCARYGQDLGYLAKHRDLEKRFPNYRYITITTREPENIDPAHPGYSGKQHLQDIIVSGRLEQDIGYAFTPATTHVFLCGNPAMIGAPHKAPDGHVVFPEPPGMVEVFARRGFQFDQSSESANLHFEKYW